ncbi:MAG: hypothetical protein IKS85_04005 [Lachnospiraceae bacterium]|nr:hypothetical protein [Lachnospiraceae bacterium]
MYTAQSVSDGKAIRQKINYFIDEDHPPGTLHEYQTYLVAARSYLGNLVINGYQFLRKKGLLEEYLLWLSGNR